jgi:hypothetical protein
VLQAAGGWQGLLRLLARPEAAAREAEAGPGLERRPRAELRVPEDAHAGPLSTANPDGGEGTQGGAREMGAIADGHARDDRTLKRPPRDHSTARRSTNCGVKRISIGTLFQGTKRCPAETSAPKGSQH